MSTFRVSFFQVTVYQCLFVCLFLNEMQKNQRVKPENTDTLTGVLQMKSVVMFAASNSQTCSGGRKKNQLKHNYHVVETVPNVPVIFKVNVKMSSYSLYS